MQYRLLGPLEALHDGAPVPLGGAKQRALLAILLLRANRQVRTDAIIDLLWGGRPPSSAPKVVQVYVSQLRKALTYVDALGVVRRGIVTVPGGYLLELTADELDVLRFDELVTRGRRLLEAGEPEKAVRAFTEALDLWRGPPLADFAFEPFAAEEIDRLEHLRLSTLEARVEAALMLGRHAEVVGELETLLAEHPARESLARLLMVAFYRSGLQAHALACFRSVRRYLSRELGLEPGVELRELHQRVLRQDEGLRYHPRVRPLESLPFPVTTFVGRNTDLARLGALVGGHRLVTVTGPGGSGKSRLAVELARSLADDRDGVHLVQLAEVGADDVLPATAAALGEREGIADDLYQTVIAAIADRRVLLVLDNTEHVVDRVAELARRLLPECPRLRLLVTSREALAVPFEQVYPLGPLPFPRWADPSAGTFPAVRLFADRAAAVLPGFELDAASLRHVVEICRRLDGLPLALELAAPMLRSMSPAELSARLDDRLALPSEGPRESPRRHRTLRDMVAWSFALLDDEELRLLRGMSVFAGGFSLRAVSALERQSPDGTLGVLTRLVRKSLVYVEERGDQTRFRLLETVRAYAAEMLAEAGEAEQWRARHAGYYLALAEEAEPHLKSGGQRDWLAVLRRETDNLRAALTHYRANGDAEHECRLAAALWRPGYLSGQYTRTRGWLESALNSGDVSPGCRVRALQGAGALALYQCDYGVAETYLNDALDICAETGDAGARADILTLLGSMRREQGRCARALELHAEAEEVYRDLGDDWGAAQALELQALGMWLDADFEGAWVRAATALEAARKVGDEERLSWCRVDLAAVAHYLDDDSDEARRQLTEALSSFESLGFKEGIAWAHNLLGVVDAAKGRSQEALDHLGQALRLHREVGDRWRISSVLEAMAGALVQQGRTRDAAILLEVTARLRADVGTPVPQCERADHDAVRRQVDTALDEAAMAAARRRAATLSIDEACTRALQLIPTA